MKPHRCLGILVISGFALGRTVLAAEPALPVSQSSEPVEAEIDPPDPIELLRHRFAETNDPSLGLAAARELVGLRRWIEAAALYLEVSELELAPEAPQASVEAKARAVSEREQLVAKIPAVVITVESASADAVNVFVNGLRVQESELGTRHRVNPGTVRVRGVLNGTRLETVVELRESEVKPVRLVFEPQTTSLGNGAPVTSPSSRESAAPVRRAPGDNQRLFGYIALGTGGAALITGGVFGVLALRDEATLESRCPNQTCSGSLETKVDSYESKKVIATIGLLSGTALAAGGAVLYLTAERRESSQSALNWAAFYDGRQAGIRGRF